MCVLHFFGPQFKIHGTYQLLISGAKPHLAVPTVDTKDSA